MSKKMNSLTKENVSFLDYLNLGFINYHTEKLSYIILFFFGIAIMYFSSNEIIMNERFRTISIEKTKKIVEISYLPVSTIKLFAENTKKYIFLIKENKTLEQENLEMKKNIINMNIEISQLKEESSLSKLSSNYNLKTDPVSVIFVSSGKSKFAIIKSNKNDIKKYRPVIVDGGLVGRIIENSDNGLYKVMLIKNEISKIPVVSINTGSRGILTGEDGVLFISRLNGKPNIGEIIITSDIIEDFAFKIPVGKVTEIKEDKIIIQPFGEIEKHTVAGVVVN